jgi:hypothetical protein
MAQAGDQCIVVVPVTPEFLANVEGGVTRIERDAAAALTRMCAEQNLQATRPRLTWQGTSAEAALISDLAPFVTELPSDLRVFAYKADAVALPS